MPDPDLLSRMNPLWSIFGWRREPIYLGHWRVNNDGMTWGRSLSHIGWMWVPRAEWTDKPMSSLDRVVRREKINAQS